MTMRTLFAVMVATWPLAALAQDAPQVRVQAADGRTYFSAQLKAPDDLRIPRAQRQALDKIALHDLGRYPRLVPQDAAARNVAWHFSADTKALEFLGVKGDEKSGRFRLLYPVEAGWKEVELTLDFTSAAQTNDLRTRWAAASAREFAVRERVAADAVELRVARQELCRTYKVADPLPRPPTGTEEGEHNIDIKVIREIEPAEQQWEKLLAGRVPFIEPLARLVPAAFYYVRIRTEAGVALLDQFERLAKLAIGIWDGAGRDYRLREHYWKQLALPAGGPKYVREAAIVGSDLHFRMGTDLTLLFVLSDENAFRAEIDAARKAVGLTAGRDQHEGTELVTYVGPAGGIPVTWAFVGGVAVCSNSPAAIRRVIDVVKRAEPSVADTPEFRLMRALFPPNAPAEDMLAFASESFLRSQFGPRHRILLRRRAAELANSRVDGAVALFRAWDAGKPIAEAPPAFSPPLIERTIDKITKAEDEFYQDYREHYRNEIAPYVAPAALRFQAVPKGVRAEAFVMAPRSADFWDAVRSKLGKGTVQQEVQEPAGTVARAVFSYTPGELDKARLKNWLIAKGVNKKHLAASIEWRGDRLAVHLGDGPALAKLAEHFLHVDLTAEDQGKSRSDMTERWLLAQLPATLSIDVAKPLIFNGWIKKVREIVEETWPKMFTWEALPGDARRFKMARVQPNPALLLLAFGKLLKPEESPGIFYAEGQRTLVLAASLDALKAGIAREIANPPREARERAAAWLALNPASSAELQGYLRTYAEREAHRQALAAATLRQWLSECGVATDEAMLRRLGFVPSAPDGSAFRRDAAMNEIVNERHGSPRAPRLNDPAADSPWLKTLADFARVHGEIHVRPDGLLGILTIER
jgi:hypothetical protein